MTQWPLYQKKPVVVSAVEWKSDNIEIIRAFVGEENMYLGEVSDALYIRTLEGDHLATPGDFIIKGVKGEYYPCKPDIFWLTYSLVQEDF